MVQAIQENGPRGDIIVRVPRLQDIRSEGHTEHDGSLYELHLLYHARDPLRSIALGGTWRGDAHLTGRLNRRVNRP